VTVINSHDVTCDAALEEVLVGGWPHIPLSCVELAGLMEADCRPMRLSRGLDLPRLVFDLNGQGLSLAETSFAYREALLQSDCIHADGQSIVFASRLFHGRNGLPERVATTDFFHDAARIAQSSGLRFFLLGGSAESIAAARAAIQEMYPGLHIVGARSGYFSEQDEAGICDEIVRAGTDVLWVGLGKPKEQTFCVRNRERLRGVGWLKTCGGLFDFLSMKNSRAPLLMQRLGFEWLYRLALEPRRLFWRYLTTNVHSMAILLIRGRRRRLDK
jgi:N-acetylglucosaminyldiphosphoundecaprenol N-acetyl-beta-D-mannosaminyltransferase